MEIFEDLTNRLRKRFKHVKKWARRQKLEAFRVYERDLPDHPFIADWYNGHVVVWMYERTRDDSQAAHAAWRQGVLNSLKECFAIDDHKLHLKERRKQKGKEQYDRFGNENIAFTLSERDIQFYVNCSDYLDTGLFLDHRDTRQRVREECSNMRVLNLFAYTGSFSCYAAKGSAKQVVTVDMSATYCDWARQNLQLNGFTDAEKYPVIQADCLQWLEETHEPFDLIVCDPPTFSNSKRMHRTWAVDRDHSWLFWRLWNHTKPGSKVYFSTNDRGFELAETGLPAFTYKEITPGSIPEDFRNKRIHRCWECTRSS